MKKETLEKLNLWIDHNFIFNNRMIYFNEYTGPKLSPLPFGGELMNIEIDLNKKSYNSARECLFTVLINIGEMIESINRYNKLVNDLKSGYIFDKYKNEKKEG